MTKRNNTYFWYGVPGIIGDIHLRSDSRIILVMTYTYLHQNKVCTLSNRTFSRWTGYKINTVSSIINRLKRKGWLYIKQGWEHYPNGTKQRARIIYGINKKKLNESTKEVAQHVGTKNVFINKRHHSRYIKHTNPKHSTFRNDMIWLFKKLLRRLEK